MYDSLLQQWASPHETWCVPTRYGDTFVIASGEKTAPPLLLLHGAGMNSAMWLGEEREYSRSFRVYAVDIPGDPGRSDERQLPLKGSAYTEWLYDVFQALDLRQASLIGISLGAWLAVKFSVSFPDKVDKLALLCPSDRLALGERQRYGEGRAFAGFAVYGYRALMHIDDLFDDG